MLPDSLSAKADPALIEADEAHLGAVAGSIDAQVRDLTHRLATARKAPGGGGTEALERDQDIHRLTARLRTLTRFGLDLCLGRMVSGDGTATYIGRLGLTDSAGDRLLSDWRSPAAAPFFGATHGNPMGLVSRRRYRWSRGVITDYWDEMFTDAGLVDATERAALDDQSAFIASLGSSRSARMRDVLGTIAADQDAIIRASSEGALVVDGGPGTGKTVVALHRAAYLLYADPHLGDHRGGILVVGPHRPYLEYVSSVLPSLGEDGVRTATLADLIPEGANVTPEADPAVERLKATAEMVGAIEPAARFYEEPPSRGMEVETPWGDLWLSADDWAAAFAAAPGAPHNEAREDVWDELLAILSDKVATDDDDEEDAASPAQVRTALVRNRALAAAFNNAWPVVAAEEVLADLWSVPAFLRRCAPHLDQDEVAALQRKNSQAWTEADLPLLDAARQRFGDPNTSRERRRREAAVAQRHAEMADVIADLIEHDDSEMQVMSMFRVHDMKDALIDDDLLPHVNADRLAGPFAHIVVDEAQELTDAQWQMLRVRCPSGSFTIVGDRAQARHGFTQSWRERLQRAGIARTSAASLRINYRTPAQVMAAAEPIIRAAIPDANVPTSIREGEVVRYGPVEDLETILDTWLSEHDGVACVIGDLAFVQAWTARDRVRALPPHLVKGLEFDLVVLVSPQSWSSGIEGAVDRYVAMTRATSQLVVLHD